MSSPVAPPSPLPAPPPPAPPKSSPLTVLILMMAVLGQAAYSIYEHRTAPVPAPAPAPPTPPVKAVIVDASGKEPAASPAAGSLLVLSSAGSTASATRWTVEPSAVQAHPEGGSFTLVVPAGPFSVRLLAIRDNDWNEAVRAFSPAVPPPAPTPGPPPNPLPPGPPPSPGPLPPDPSPPPPPPKTAAEKTAAAYLAALGRAFIGTSADMAGGKADKTNYDKALQARINPAAKDLAAFIDASPDVPAVLQELGTAIGGK